MNKLDGGLFRYALSQTSLTAGEVLAVGDCYIRDIQGAHSVGINSIWLSDILRHNSGCPTLLNTIPHISKLSNAVERLALELETKL
jgi:FMN phosphatase YigB (HAD superfamily)